MVKNEACKENLIYLSIEMKLNIDILKTIATILGRAMVR
jgi:hypothetical protein